MLMDAPVYLLDEPSAALDAQTEKFIIDNFIDFVQQEKKQLIMITHSERLADSLEDSIIRLDKGRVTEAYDE
jgi:putative ABC transport system ATP-binding protein